MKQHICIIGGSGFIGTKIAFNLSLNKNFSFNIIDKVSSKVFPHLTDIADIRYIHQLKNKLIDNSIIINLAAIHHDNIRPLSLYDDVNIGGAINICDIARKSNINTIIFTSSVAVYGFAPIDTDESGKINPFNDYGRTKFEAEKIFSAWQIERPEERKLIIIRPTVVFGEQNRGNVYKLIRQVASGKFMMIGNGENRKSMAYVENVAAFIIYSLSFKPGIHIFNYVDKPDLSMNSLIHKINSTLNKSDFFNFKLPYLFGYMIGKGFDLLSFFTKKQFSISSIRIRKFCSDSVFTSSVNKTDFIPPVSLEEAIEKTIRYEFLEKHSDDITFFSE